MKTLGLLGGMSWESTIPYYRVINQTVNERLGGLHSAEILLYSIDFQRIEELQVTDRWSEAAEMLSSAARRLENAGAELLVLCTNTMHKVAQEIEAGLSIPLLHIADATGERIRQCGLSSVGLLGTRFTMEQDFYRRRLETRFGLHVVIPDEPARRVVHRVIYEELCRGQICEESRREYRKVLHRLAASGAEGIVLGCTEISLLVGPLDSPVPLFDTTEIHARRAAELALEPGS
jgi:aspartate racemase